MRIRSVSIIAMVSALTCAGPATASFGWCMGHIPGKDHTQILGNYNTTYPSYVSGIIDFGPNDERKKAIEMQFGASVGATTDGVTCLTGSDEASSSNYYKAEFIKKGLGQHIDTGWTGGFAASGGSRAKSVSPGAALAPNEVSISFGGSRTKANVERPVPNKYVEVQGPNGTIRLSPEVAARNQAAADEYRRKMEEHDRAMAAHEQRLAQHRQNAATAALAKQEHEREVAKAAAVKREYERQLAVNAAQVAAHKAQTANLEGSGEGTFQATSPFRATKDEAMSSLMSQNLPPISNVQCKEVTFYKPSRWTCWGTYRQTVTRSSTSKQ